MTGFESLGITISDFNDMKAGGKLSLGNGEYLFEDSGNIMYRNSAGTVYDIRRIPKSLQTDIMLRIKMLYRNTHYNLKHKR